MKRITIVSAFIVFLLVGAGVQVQAAAREVNKELRFIRFIFKAAV